MLRVLQWLPSTLKIKPRLSMMLSTGCLTWPLISYHVPSPLGFSHSSLCESSSNSRSILAFAFAALCLNTFLHIWTRLAPKLHSSLFKCHLFFKRRTALPDHPKPHRFSLLPHPALVFFPALVPLTSQISPSLRPLPVECKLPNRDLFLCTPVT